MDAESVYKQAALREEDPEDEIGFSQRKGKPTKLLRHASGKKKNPSLFRDLGREGSEKNRGLAASL